MVNEQKPGATAVETFRHYTEAFEALDPRAVAQHFHLPALLITRERVVALNSGAAVEEAYGRVMAGLPALGFAKAEFPSLVERRLSDALSVVTGLSIWEDASGAELHP
ncbi:hypothetical protein [Anaeromyxobacter sp. Fw109-5]|uniref:hypothetical protein n=1 Tax=Anaeromyxobacter sp. (strain Fw109-5) TaxID=404589 RepID=UPI0000ED8AEB|nr:hypothetical protein [Anaeromyxobacter sp. Fw109-5]ABS27470.1 hypothetical protein Anae109_3281 [Anaeromyxobacter sp. Fw109-5]